MIYLFLVYRNQAPFGQIILVSPVWSSGLLPSLFVKSCSPSITLLHLRSATCITRRPSYSGCFQDRPTVEESRRSVGLNDFDGSVQAPWWQTCHASSSGKPPHMLQICSSPSHS